MDLSIFFAGTAGSVPSARRGLPAVLVRRGGAQLLFDCGEGTQRQLVRSVGLADLDDVFITHMHADHWLGLPGMLKSFELRDRTAPLRVFGPPGLQDQTAALRRIYGRLSYSVTFTELEPAQAVPGDGYEIVAFAVSHRGRAYGYALVESERPGRLDAQLAERLGVSPGPDFGRLQRGETVGGVRSEQVMSEPRPGRKLVFSGDTSPCDAVALAADGADVLVHEATFGDDEADRARQTGHSTARAAAGLARDAGVGMLALTHISSRYHGRELRDEARAVFAPTVLPRDFDTIEIPLAERGRPQLVHWRRGESAASADSPATDGARLQPEA